MDFYHAPYVGPTSFFVEQAPYDPRRNTYYGDATAFTGVGKSSSANTSRESVKGSGVTSSINDSLSSVSGADSSRALTLTSADRPLQPIQSSRSSVITDFESIARQRVRLLAMKYADPKGVTGEITARLEILSARLSNVAPRVTAAQVASLEQAAEAIALIQKRRKERSVQLQLLART